MGWCCRGYWFGQLFWRALAKAKIVKEGKDITIVAWSMMQLRAQKAADLLHREGISVDLIDPRTIKPLDMKTIINSVKRPDVF